MKSALQKVNILFSLAFVFGTLAAFFLLFTSQEFLIRGFSNTRMDFVYLTMLFGIVAILLGFISQVPKKSKGVNKLKTHQFKENDVKESKEVLYNFTGMDGVIENIISSDDEHVQKLEKILYVVQQYRK